MYPFFYCSFYDIGSNKVLWMSSLFFALVEHVIYVSVGSHDVFMLDVDMLYHYFNKNKINYSILLLLLHVTIYSIYKTEGGY